MAGRVARRGAVLVVRLLFDAGCRVFWRCAAPPVPNDEAADAQERDDNDTGAMEIGMSSVPPGTAEMELQYGGLFVRGYEWQDGFIVAAKSEIRVDMVLR